MIRFGPKSFLVIGNLVLDSGKLANLALEFVGKITIRTNLDNHHPIEHAKETHGTDTC